MKFVQHIRFKTSKEAEVIALMKSTEDVEMSGDPEGWLLRDRDNPGQYVASVVFDSADAAAKNNDLPATQDFAAKMMELCDGPPEFGNYDLILED